MTGLPVPPEVAAYAAGLRFSVGLKWPEVAVTLNGAMGENYSADDLQAAAKAWAEKNLPRDSIAWTDADYGPDAKGSV